MDLWVLGLILILTLTLSVVISRLIPRLTAGSPEPTDNVVDERREMQPVVSQCGVSIPAISQILQPDPDAVPGAMKKMWQSDNLHFFDNTEIVDKLCGPAITQAVLDGWRNVEKSWQKEYSVKSIATDMEKVQGVKTGLYASASKGIDFRPSGEYYNRPVEHCTSKPNKFPCPNNWREPPTYKKAPSSGDMFIPDMSGGRKVQEPVLDYVTADVVVNRRMIGGTCAPP
jgi:hypothetical protein